MAMQDWIHRYPHVERLLQRDPDEDLSYDADLCDIPRLAFRPPQILDDEEYRRALRELRAEITQQQEALDRLVLAELEDFRQALHIAQVRWGTLGFEDGAPVLPASTIPEESA
jgi:hypothetical protein